MYRDNARAHGGNRVCSFYQQGRCKFGDGCKFEHPGANRQQEPSNRFAALSGQNGIAVAGRGRSPPSGRGDQVLPFNLSKDGIVADMKTERPQWPFSAYGPGKDAPRQLFGGFPLEQSFEEMRVIYYLAQASGNVQSAIQSEQELLQQSQQQTQQVLNDVDGALKYVIDGEHEHPNRLDMCKANSGAVQAPQNPFGGAQPAGGTFGQPSNLSTGATSQPTFGTSSFGKPSSPFGVASTQQSAFGKPSVPSSTFGQASAPAQTSNAFGQPSAPAQSSAFGSSLGSTQTGGFGNTSTPELVGAFGRPFPAANSASTFGKPSVPGQASAFGQPSVPGQTSAFGQPSVPGQASAFGQPSVPGQASGFAQSSNAFGQPSNTTQPSPFARQGSAPAFGQPSQPSQQSPFAQNGQGQGSGAFGQPSKFGGGQTAGGFGSTSSFGQASQQPQPQTQSAQNPFGSKPAEPQNASPFGRTQTQTQAAPNAFGRPSPSPFAQPSQAHPSPFVQSATTSQPTAFGAQDISTSASPFAQQSSQPQSSMMNGSTYAGNGTPDPSTYLKKAPNGTLQSFKGQPVSYIDQNPHYQRPDNRKPERIWFPDGPPGPNRYTEETPEAYAKAGPVLEEQYKYLAETGTFKDGLMPMLAPQREWVRFDL